MLHEMLEAIYFDPESRRIHSIVPRETFAAPFRNMAERDDVTLRQFSDLELEANWKLRDARDRPWSSMRPVLLSTAAPHTWG